MDRFITLPPPKTCVVRLKARNGQIVQDCDVYIGRACHHEPWDFIDSKWGNPFTVKESGSAHEAVRRYEEYILKKPDLLASLPELKGKRLGCWCKPGPCHGDVLVKLIRDLH